MIIELDTETEALITELANQEKTSAAQLIKKLLADYFDSKKQPELLTDFAGLLSDSPSFKGNPIDIQKAMRDEWN